MSRLLRRTLLGAAVGASAFGVVSVYQAISSGVALGALIGPLAFMMLLGGTIGGLAGPLLGEGFARTLGRRKASNDRAP